MALWSGLASAPLYRLDVIQYYVLVAIIVGIVNVVLVIILTRRFVLPG